MQAIRAVPSLSVRSSMFFLLNLTFRGWYFPTRPPQGQERERSLLLWE